MLVDSESPGQLAAAVDAFFTTSDRTAMQTAAAASARKYSWEEYGALFRRLSGRTMKLNPRRIKVGLELTSKCNLRCGMCPLPVLRRPYEDMVWPMVEKAEREIHGAGLKLKWLHEMGEPLLYARIDDAIRPLPRGQPLDERLGAHRRRSARSCWPRRSSASASASTPSTPRSIRRLRTGGDFDKLVVLTRAFLDQAKGPSHPHRDPEDALAPDARRDRRRLPLPLRPRAVPQCPRHREDVRGARRERGDRPAREVLRLRAGRLLHLGRGDSPTAASRTAATTPTAIRSSAI